MIDVPALLEAFTELSVVVNLPVEDKPNAIAAAVHRLIAGRRKIDDRKPAKPKTQARFIQQLRAGIIGTAVRHRVAHAFDQRQIDAPLARAVLPDSADATHRVSPRSKVIP